MLQATEFSFSSFSSSIQSSLFNAFLPVLIITHIFWDTFTSHGDKPSCIEETTYNLCFGDPLCRRLQKLVGNDKPRDGVSTDAGDDPSIGRKRARTRRARLVSLPCAKHCSRSG